MKEDRCMQFKTVGSYEAKTHFSALLDTVVHGEKVVITREGIPVAILIPYKEEKNTVEETIKALLLFRKKLHLNGLSIREMRKSRGHEFE
jgi:prevent-host-death family protein